MKNSTVEPVKRPLDLIIRPAGVSGMLILTVGMLTLAHITGQILLIYLPSAAVDSVARFFSLTGENNLASYFSASLLLACAVLLAIIARGERLRTGESAAHWVGLAAIFAFLSIDEGLSIHTMFNEPMQGFITALGGDGYAWMIPYGVFVALLAALYLDFLVRLPRRTRTRAVWAAVLYLGGAIGLSIVANIRLAGAGGVDAIVFLYQSAGEVLEMLGAVVFVDALLNFMSTEPERVRINVTNRRALVAEPTVVEGRQRSPLAIPQTYAPVFARPADPRTG